MSLPAAVESIDPDLLCKVCGGAFSAKERDGTWDHDFTVTPEPWTQGITRNFGQHGTAVDNELPASRMPAPDIDPGGVLEGLGSGGGSLDV
jgi:hypothetical protein